MAETNHEVNVTISAKNKVQAGLSQAGAAIKEFGTAVANVFKAAAGAIAAAGAAIGAIAVKAVAAYSVQEEAERKLIAAHNAMGEAGAEYIESEKKIAAAIQNETAVGDELTLARMGQLRMLGVMPEKLGEAAKGVIALTNAGLGDEAAVRAMALAVNGNYTVLQRYIPALKDCTSEMEKQQLVTGFLDASYRQQCETLDTTKGRWAELQGRIGDAWEVLGMAINQNGALSDALKWCADKVLELSDAFSNWCRNGGLAEAILAMKYFGENVKFGIQNAITSFEEFCAQAKYYLCLPFNYVGSVIGSFVNMVWEGIKLCGSKIAYLWDTLKGKEVPPPDTKAFDAAFDILAEAAKGNSDEITDAQKELNSELEALAAQREADAKEHADKILEIEQGFLEEMERKSEEAQEKVKPAPSIVPPGGYPGEIGDIPDGEIVFKMAPEDSEIMKGIKDGMAEDLKKVQDDIQKQKQTLQKAQDEARESIRELNNMDLKEAAKRARREEKLDKKAEKKAEREERRANELQKRVDHGGTLTKNQESWLKEYKKREDAKKNIQQNVNKLEQALNNQLKEEREIKGTLQMLGKDLTQLLKAT